MGELQMYGTVNWLNASDDLGKMKKGTELLTLLFIFKTGVVLMAQERIKGKRKPRVRVDLSFIARLLCLILCNCLLYTSPSPRDRTRSRMPSSA